MRFLFSNDDIRLKIMLTEANYRILQPIVYVGRVFGICPVFFKKIGNYYQIKYSRWLVLYSYAFIFIFGIGTIIGVRRDIDAGPNAVRLKSVRTRYITLSDMAMAFLIALYGVISIPYRMRRFVRMLDIWSYVDKLIPISNYQKYRRNSIVLMIVTVAATLSLYLFDLFIYCMQWRVSNDPTFYLQNYISYYMLYFMLVFQELFFWHLVFFIHIRIKSLNEQLTKEKNNLKNKSKKIFLIPYTLDYMVKNTSIPIQEKEKVGEKNQSAVGAPKFSNTNEKMLELMNIYGKVRESVEILNDSASFGVMLLMLSCLVHLVVTPYFLLVEMTKKSPSFVFMGLQAAWFLGHIGRLMIMVEPCQTCLREYKMTCNLVSEMFQMEFDNDTKKILKCFASQFSYAMISFNACGFFNIDRNLLTSVAGAVTTYLVILFQFNGN